MKLVSFLVFLAAIEYHTWWLFVLAFLLWQVAGSGNIVKSLWVLDKLHDRNSDHGP